MPNDYNGSERLMVNSLAKPGSGKVVIWSKRPGNLLLCELMLENLLNALNQSFSRLLFEIVILHKRSEKVILVKPPPLNEETRSEEAPAGRAVRLKGPVAPSSCRRDRHEDPTPFATLKQHPQPAEEERWPLSLFER